MYIVQYQHVYQLIEMYEIIYLVILRMLDELVDEFFGAYIQCCFVGMRTAHFVAYCLHEVCFTPAHSAEYYQRVERGSPRFLRYVKTRRTCHAVAIAFYIIIESIVGVQLRVYL